MIDVLLIEDSAADARLVQLDLESADDPGFSITHVVRLEEALRLLETGHVDIILSDLNLPDSKGIDTFTRLNDKAPEIPIILLTGFNDESLAMHIVKEGAEDYIVKGEVKGRYLIRAVQFAIERKGLRKKLQEQNRQFQEMLRVDPLTGLYSRRYILDCVDDEVARHNRYNSPLAVIHLDVDDFKRINDDYGHNSGDQALRDVAVYIQNSIREVDKAARYGGDEFLILLPDSDAGAAEAVCEKLTAGTITSVISPGTEIELSLSIGAASADRETTATQLIDTADFAMLTAKKSGKGRYFAAAELIDRDAGEENIAQLQEARNTLREVICQLVGASLNELEREQDIYDGVAEIMRLICDGLTESLELSKEQQRTLYNVIQVVRFQDLGIAAEMLEGAELLSSMQHRVLRDRFRYNISLLKKIRFLQEETEVLENLHEQYNSGGFPDGKKGGEIPFLSRIVSVVYEYARISRRTGGITEGCGREALEKLRSLKGKKFDPDITEAVIREIEAMNDGNQAASTGDVLIIEDDEINVRLLDRYLTKAGYTVTPAYSVAQGKKRLSEKKWDIVFLDIMLPDGDGRDLLPEIRNLPRKPLTAVTSSCFDEETITGVKESGADIFLIKPLKLRLLLRLLASYRANSDAGEGMRIISGLTSITELR